MTGPCEFAAFVQATAQVALVLPFAVGGMSKVRDQSSSRRLWEAAGFGGGLPWRALPALELGVAGVLLLGVAASWVFAATVLIVLTIALQRALARGYRDDCGCLGGADGRSVGPVQIGRNLVLLALALAGLAATASCGDLAVWQHPVPTFLAGAAAAVVATTAYLFLAHAERLLGANTGFSLPRKVT